MALWGLCVSGFAGQIGCWDLLCSVNVELQSVWEKLANQNLDGRDAAVKMRALSGQVAVEYMA